MNRENLFINAFVIVVFIVCLLSSFTQTTEIDNLIYALILPIFLITILEFLIEIRDAAEKIVKERREAYDKLSKLEHQTAELTIENLKLKNNFDENNLPKNVENDYKNSIEHCNIATDGIKAEIFLYKLYKPLKILYTLVLVLFFISIMFFNTVSHILKNINLNSISMWSVLILLISIYYKNNIATKIANSLYKYYDKKRKEKLNINSVDNKNK